MTNPLPESAVELAAIELAKKWNLWPADAERMAREAIRAALPAIREAVVGCVPYSACASDVPGFRRIVLDNLDQLFPTIQEARHDER